MAVELNEAQKEEVKRMKQYFTFRVVYGAVKGDQFECRAMKTERRAWKLVHEGWTVFLAGRNLANK